jgi:predicted kinase
LAVYQASLRISNEQLYLLARSDVRGRKSTGQDDFLDRIELYRLFCEEQDCWNQPKEFANRHSQFKYFQKQDLYPSTLYNDTAFEVIIMVGMPGSGKDTKAATLDLPIVSLDAIRVAQKIKPTDKKGQGKVAQIAYEQAKKYAAQKQSFVWNSTNLTIEMRQKITNKLAPYNPYFKIIYVETSKKNILERRRATIPVKTLEKMFRALEIPTANEGHEVVWERN